MKNMTRVLEQEGYVITEPILDKPAIDDILACLNNVQPGDAVLERYGSVYGVRDLLRQAPGIQTFLQTEPVRNLVTSFLGPHGRMVRAIFFDKTPEANWKVPWHQDCTIAVKRKIDVPEFDLWTTKAGIQHVRPPSLVLERMVTMRFHLDDCDETNGALKIIAKSHTQGRLPETEVQNAVQQGKIMICNVKAGSVFIMKPLLIHASSPASHPKHRRVLHFEFSADDLPGGLEWYDAT